MSFTGFSALGRVPLPPVNDLSSPYLSVQGTESFGTPLLSYLSLFSSALTTRSHLVFVGEVIIFHLPF